MIDPALKQTMETMRQRGMAIRAIARELGLSKNTVRRVVQGRHSPGYCRASAYEPHLELIGQLLHLCRGNSVRVQQMLADAHAVHIPYTLLTALVRRCQLRQPQKKPAGTYVFAPGQEMQHDTSEDRVMLADHKPAVQCAGLAPGYSRMGYVQFYPRFTRLEALAFLTAAFAYMGGTCARCTIDNTSVLVAGGTGPDAVMAEKVRQFAAHYGTVFIAHAVGHADRKAHIERLFAYVQGNFPVGREFTEKPHLTPLPDFIPAIYLSDYRVVDIYGDVHLDTNRYSVPYRYIGQKVEVQKHIDTVKVYAGGHLIAEHARCSDQRNRRVSNPAHRGPLYRASAKGP